MGEQIEVSINQGEVQTATATIVSAEGMVSNQARHLKYRAQIENNPLGLKHNHLVKVTFPTSALSSQIMIPNLAVNKAQLGNYVFLVKEESEGVFRAQQQKVQLGQRIGNMVIVSEGLEVGNIIANQGAFKLRPGLKVYLANPQPQNDALAANIEDKAGETL